MKYSILVPVYNVEKYVEACIQSVLSQTYTDYELILVDDGSTDQSGSICDEYAKKYSQIKVYHKPNAGLIHTRRYGISKASGEWYIFLDSDDTLDKNALETIDQYTNESDCVIYGYERILNGKVVYREHDSEALRINDKRQLYRKVFIDGGYNALWRKAVKSNLIGNIDYSQYYHISMGEDLLQSLEILENCEKVTFIPDILYKYRVNPKSITQSITVKNFAIDFTVRKKVLEFLRKENVFAIDDYNSYRDYCLDVGLFENLLTISNLNTTDRDKRELCIQLKETAYYVDFLSAGYSKGYKNQRRRFAFELFQKGFYLVLLRILKA